MVIKSLPTFKHTSVGAKTHEARTATAHVSYIMRSEAMTKFQCENMPDGGRGTRVFFDKLWEKASMPENARICDKLMIALPLELNPEQRYDAVHSFMQELGQGRIAWCAAHHDSGEDSHNPHAHIVFKDADIATGGKVIGTTTSSRDVREAEVYGWKAPPRMTTADMRAMWCAHINACMERAGLDIRYDPRTLKEQGIDREAQIHIGPKAQALEEKGYNFKSLDRIRGERSLAYTLLDQTSRAGHNNRIITGNKEHELSPDSSPNREASPSFAARAPLLVRPLSPGEKEQHELQKAQAKERQALYAEQKLDREALKKAQTAAQLDHQISGRKLYADARQAAFETIKEQYDVRWKDLRANTPFSQRKEASTALKAEQKTAYAEEAKRRIDQVRPEKDTAWKALKDSQEKERLALQAEHRTETTVLARQHVAERLAIYEKWRAQALDKQAQRVAVKLSGPQGLAPQDLAARKMMALHAKATRLGNIRELPANPREAAKAYMQIAYAEEAKRAPLREALLKTRVRNLDRAAPAAFSERMLASKGKSAVRFAAPAADKAAPRQIMLPGLLDAHDDKASALRRVVRQSEQAQSQARQAVASGRTPSDAERANASPDIRQRLSDREVRALAIRNLSSAGSGGDARGRDRSKDRSGGGRGR